MKIKKALLLVLICIVLASCNSENNNGVSSSKDETNSNSSVLNIENADYNEMLDNIPVTRSIAAKMISLTFSDNNSINTLDYQINFSDVEKDSWYSNYVNAVVVYGYMLGDSNKFYPDEPLTLSQAQILLNKVVPDNKVQMKLTDENRNVAISYALWTKLYNQCIMNITDGKSVTESYGIAEDEIIVLANPKNTSALPQWTMITDKGPLFYKGLETDKFINKKIKIQLKGDEIFCIEDVISDEPVLESVYISNINGKTISVFSGGVEKNYILRENLDTPTPNSIADIKIKEDEITAITPVSEKFEGVVKQLNESYIEFEEHGKYPFSENVKVYSNTDNIIKWKTIANILTGSNPGEFYIKDNKICAVILNKKTDPENIRVVINNSNFTSLYHEKVELTANADYVVRSNNEDKSFKAGEKLTIDTKSNLLENSLRIYVKSSIDNGKIEILSLTRGSDPKPPLYSGIIEISPTENGFVIVNELPIEQYLYAVIGSEMPVSYGEEALKTQAVAARSYAYSQYYKNNFHGYGANIDDSTSSQVYNNVPESEETKKAVDSTKGECITYSGNVVAPNYFSTSSGYTANSGEVWANGATKEFPTNTPDYLKAHKEYDGEEYGDLSIEENADKFFKSTSVASVENTFPWFRWNVSMSSEDLSSSINSNIKERYELNPSLIKTKQPNGIYLSKSISTIGNIKDIKIVKRGEGGNVMEIEITGSENAVLVKTEQNIRSLLKPVQNSSNKQSIVLNRSDGSKISNYSLLPSAFFAVEGNKNIEGEVISFVFYGGGNGHGVGMSQSGVKSFSDKGYSYKEIIEYYYDKTKVIKMY